MIKTEIRILLALRATLSEFWFHLDQEHDNVYFYMDGSP